MKRFLVVAAVAVWAVPAMAADRWRLCYSYDSPDASEFVITGLAFPAPRRGMAVGYLDTGRKGKPYAVTTLDGGEKWEPARIPEPALSLFFLNGKTGWLVGRDNIWRTSDFGLNWKKLARAPGALRVFFLDDQRGWVVGSKKMVRETRDGGASWKDVEAAAQPKTTPDYTVYGAIAFATPEAGMITGWSIPPRRGDRTRPPDWVDPSQRRREWPGIAITLQTKDAGVHWNAEETSMFGQITSLSLTPDKRGLGLVEFFDRFEYPSEVYAIDWQTGKSVRVFRRKDRAITDVLVTPQGQAYLAGFEPSGTLFRSPVPGKLKVLKSGNLEDWQDMEVDYRAVARRAILASAGPGGRWIATDTGMILALATE